MREIKFRFWDKDEKEMIYGLNEGLKHWEDTLKNGADRLLNMHSHVPVMQYTGLKDKNGKEIYEGDVVYDGSVLWTVEFKDGCFLGVIEQGTYLHAIDNLEIAGCIYENPEKLGKKPVPK